MRCVIIVGTRILAVSDLITETKPAHDPIEKITIFFPDDFGKEVNSCELIYSEVEPLEKFRVPLPLTEDFHELAEMKDEDSEVEHVYIRFHQEGTDYRSKYPLETPTGVDVHIKQKWSNLFHRLKPGKSYIRDIEHTHTIKPSIDPQIAQLPSATDLEQMMWAGVQRLWVVDQHQVVGVLNPYDRPSRAGLSALRKYGELPWEQLTYQQALEAFLKCCYDCGLNAYISHDFENFNRINPAQSVLLDKAS